MTEYECCDVATLMIEQLGKHTADANEAKMVLKQMICGLLVHQHDRTVNDPDEIDVKVLVKLVMDFASELLEFYGVENNFIAVEAAEGSVH